MCSQAVEITASPIAHSQDENALKKIGGGETYGGLLPSANQFRNQIASRRFWTSGEGVVLILAHSCSFSIQ